MLTVLLRVNFLFETAYNYPQKRSFNRMPLSDWYMGRSVSECLVSVVIIGGPKQLRVGPFLGQVVPACIRNQSMCQRASQEPASPEPVFSEPVSSEPGSSELVPSSSSGFCFNPRLVTG